MEDRIAITVALSLFIGFLWGSYQIGVNLERRAYLHGFVTQVEAAYWEGFDDGQRLEKFKQQGKRKGL